MNITILLRHSSVWKSELVFERYQSDGIVVGENISYVNLRSTIANELEIDETKKKIELRYIVENNASTMSIRNDMGVKLYIELKKSEPEFSMYPICVNVSDITRNETILSDTLGGPVVCIEGSEDDVRPLSMIVSNIDVSSYLTEFEITNYINDTTGIEVKEKQFYKNKATLISVMAKYKIQNNFNFRVKRSDSRSYVLRCSSDECSWSFRVSSRKNSDIFKVRSFNGEHTCPLRVRIFNNVEATTTFVSAFVAPKLVNHKRVHTPKDIQEDFKAAHGIDISYQKAWRAKEHALEMLRGKPADGYRQMPRYIHVLNTVYPNSYIRMHKSPKNEFMYLFIALRQLIRGFQFCRPVVVVDGAHLDAPYKGTFLSASTLDGAGNIFPLAYGVVDTENDCSWTWFFEQFKNAFGVRNSMCIVSDRNESIMNSVRIVFPSVPHYACIWHLWKNVCTNYRRSKNLLSDLFYSMAKAYRKDDFEKIMAKVDKIDHRVKEYLENAGYEKWSRAYAMENRGRMMTSNIAECINKCLVEARQLPILDLLEETRMLFGAWICKYREKASYTNHTLGEKFEDILVLNTSKCSRMKVVPSSEYIYSVYGSGRRYIVCLETKKCSCGRFQIDELPCTHAIAVLKSKNIADKHPYCSDYYKPDALKSTYELPIVPMPDKKEWNVPKEVLEEVVLPPKYKRMPGRPKKERKKNCSEKISTSTNCCGRCGQEGHNRRTCNFIPVEK